MNSQNDIYIVCFKHRSIEVTLGEHDKRYLSKNNIKTGVKATVVHEKYKHGPEKYPKYLNDIGMMLISKKLKETGAYEYDNKSKF